MTVTIKDVAEKAGVSSKTVSNVIHGTIYVSDEKRQRVLAAIDQLHYKPNLPARYLRQRQTKVFAFIVPDLCNPYLWEVSNAVVEAAAAHSYTVLIGHTNSKRESELSVINGMSPHVVDGIILNPISLIYEDLCDYKVDLPIVLLGERLLGAPFDHIILDNVAAVRTAIEHLLQLGRRRIAVIRVHEDITGETARQRLRGYTEGLATAGIAFDERLIIQAQFYGRSDGYQAIKQLLALDQPPDAVFCFNDLLALGAMRALNDAGLRIPEDVAVVGFDGIEEGNYTSPSLTTIAPDKKKIGELAVKLLLDRIHGNRTGDPIWAETPFQLRMRESTIRQRQNMPIFYESQSSTISAGYIPYNFK